MNDPQAKARTLAQYKYFMVYQTRWNDNDQYSHINNSVYSLLYDSIINKYLVEHCGLQPGDTSSTATSSLSPRKNHQNSPETIPPLVYNQGVTPSFSPHPEAQHNSKPPSSFVPPLEAEKLPHAESEVQISPIDVIGLVVSSWSTFHRPLSFPSRLLLGMRVTNLGRSSVSYEVGVFGPLLEAPLRSGHSGSQLESESVAAVGGFTHVFVDKEKRRPIKGLPRPLLEGLGGLCSERSGAKL